MHEGAAGAVAGKNFVGGQGSDFRRRHALRLQQLRDLPQIAPAHQRFALRQTIGEQQIVVVRVGGCRLGRDDEINRHNGRALMQKLEKGVLSVGAGFAPDHGAGLPRHGRTIALHGFAVALHIQLLEIGGKARQALVIGNDSMGGQAADIAIPDAEHRHDNRDILVQRGRLEVLVSAFGPAQKGFKMLAANGNYQRQADAGPD